MTSKGVICLSRENIMKLRDFLVWPILLLTLAFTTQTIAQERTIKVEIRTLKTTSAVVPRVKIEIGADSATTDDRGRATIMVSPGTHFARVAGPCQIGRISLIGSVRRYGGSDKEPILEFPFPSNQSPTVTFLLRCDTDLVPGMIRVKIATRTSCMDDPNGEVKLQSGVTVRIGEKQYTSDEKGVIDVDIPPGSYPISGLWHDYSFGYVTQNGVRQRGGESGQISVTFGEKVETLEVRMFSCDETGQERARAEIVEIGVTQSGPGSIEVRRSQASGKGFVGMKLRDGDTVRVNGTAAIRWLSGNGTIRFEDPRRTAVFVIGPDKTPPTGNPAGKSFITSLFELKDGLATFLFPKNHDEDLQYDENGNPVKFKASTHTIITSVKGTTFTIEHDKATEKSTVTVTEGVVAVTPKFPVRAPFDLNDGQRAEISPTGVNGPTAAAGQGELNVKTTKPVYAPGETIHVDYSNPKASGWDWVVIVQPSKLLLASGPHSSVTSCSGPCHAVNFDPNNNSVREVSNRASFPPLPEGDYEARYISWDGGNNLPKAAFPFKVGNVASPPPAGDGNSQPGGNMSPGDRNPPPPTFGDLTGLWRNPGANAVYRVRQVGSKIVWGLDAVAMGSWANMFQGQMTGDKIDGVWEDLPGSPTIGGGRMLLKVESSCRFVRVSSVNPYGADVWVKQGSTCDIAGTQRPPTAATTKTSPPNVDRVVVSDQLARDQPVKPPGSSTSASTNNSKPKVEEIPDETIVRKPANPTPKPKIEEIPDGETISKVSGKPNKPTPKVEEIPEEITVAKNNDDNDVFINETTTKEEQTLPAGQQPQPKPQKTPKPKKEGPGFWEKLGTAINQAATQQQQQPQQPPPTGGTTQQPQRQPDGTCIGGSYWLGTATATRTSGFQIAWSSPFGADRHHFRTYRAGTNQFVGDNDQPQNANACGLSWHFYLPAGQYDVYLFPGTMANTRNVNTSPVAGPLRITVTP